MPTVILFGAGNVASHIGPALQATGYEIAAVVIPLFEQVTS